jgi:hypothetical protein
MRIHRITDSLRAAASRTFLDSRQHQADEDGEDGHDY